MVNVAVSPKKPWIQPAVVHWPSGSRSQAPCELKTPPDTVIVNVPPKVPVTPSTIDDPWLPVSHAPGLWPAIVRKWPFLKLSVTVKVPPLPGSCATKLRLKRSQAQLGPQVPESELVEAKGPSLNVPVSGA